MIDTKLLHFQKDLRDGLTIEEALQKYGYTFKYVCDNLPRKYERKPKKPGGKRKK